MQNFHSNFLDTCQGFHLFVYVYEHKPLPLSTRNKCLKVIKVNVSTWWIISTKCQYHANGPNQMVIVGSCWQGPSQEVKIAVGFGMDYGRILKWKCATQWHVHRQHYPPLGAGQKPEDLNVQLDVCITHMWEHWITMVWGSWRCQKTFKEINVLSGTKIV